MKRWLLAVWAALPLAAAAYHYGPGQVGLTLDQIDRLSSEAERLVADGAWEQAILRYEEALEKLPEDQVEAQRRLKLELYKAQLEGSKLPEAHRAIGGLVDELAADPAADPALLAEARDVYADTRFYMTWLMRLEGQAEEVWRPEIAAAEETYRLLSETTAADDTEARKRALEDLEASVKLARMDLGELQGLPLPSQ